LDPFRTMFNPSNPIVPIEELKFHCMFTHCLSIGVLTMRRLHFLRHQGNGYVLDSNTSQVAARFSQHTVHRRDT
jgi:hypothetical protein